MTQNVPESGVPDEARDRITQLLLDLKRDRVTSDSGSAGEVVPASASGAAVRPRAADRLLPLVYDDFRRLAERYLRRERSDHTLQATALAHEAYLQLVDQQRVDWQGRTHFMAVAAQAMRRILVDHARAHNRIKRGGKRQRVTLDEALAVSAEQRDADILSLDEALGKLEQLDARQAQVVELRFFGGLSVEEVAEALGVSKRTVEGDWTMARAWLRRELGGRLPGQPVADDESPE